MTTVKCEYCGHQLDEKENAAKCPHCGLAINAANDGSENIDATLDIVQDKTAQGNAVPSDGFDKTQTRTLTDPVRDVQVTAVADEAKFANAPEYSMTMKASSSATDSIDLSS
ncbi:MAG: hypothetical protein P8J33_01420, partial [Pirellulaceae bacterium]|nr:hypothetical protein [Pirellulaceae bacterium]